MPVIIVSLCTVLVLYMLGWRYNLSEQSVAQGGLMQFNSRPAGAKVTLDGTTVNGTTSTRQDVAAGMHNVIMERSGYLPWQKTVSMEPGKILWLNYTRLIPEKIAIEQIESYDQLDGALSAPYGEERLLLQPSIEAPNFEMVRTDNDQAPRSQISLPADELIKPAKGQTQKFSMRAWDQAARYVLVTQQIDKTTQWLVLDTRDPARSQNVSQILDQPIEDLQFDVNNSRLLYAQSKNSLLRIDLTRRTTSEPLVSMVESFRQSEKGVITYVAQQKDSSRRFVGYYTAGATNPKRLTMISDDPKARLEAEIVEYTGRQFLVTRLNQQLNIARINLHPSDSTSEVKLNDLQSFRLPAGSGSIEISREGRFIIAQKGASFVTYDFEFGRLTTISQTGEDKPRPVRWLDNHILWSDRGGILHTYEFDGENGHPIMNVAAGFDVSLSPDGRYLYAIEKTEQGFSLSRARLILP